MAAPALRGPNSIFLDSTRGLGATSNGESALVAIRHNHYEQYPYITPYLSLRARLSQAWFNRWTILLLLVLVRTLFAIADIEDGINEAHKEALSACAAVEAAGSALASMPHYMAEGTNELAAHGVTKAVHGLMEMLTLTVTGVEELVVFFINLLTQTYVCLITLAISGSLHVALSVIEDVANFLNTTLGDIGRDINSGISDFEGAINKAFGILDHIPAAFGSGDKLPTLTIPNDALARLNHLTLPAGLDHGLTKLNNSIPTFTQVNNFTKMVISLPFEEIKHLINESLPTYQFNKTLLPVPQKQSVVFCRRDSGIPEFFEALIDIERTARKIAIAVLLILALAVIVPMALREWYRWKSTLSRAQDVHDHAHDAIDSVYIISRPFSASAGIRLASYFSTFRNQTLVRWVVAYFTSESALLVLSFGIAGLFSCLCHYLVLRAVVKEVPKLTVEVGDIASNVVTMLDNASLEWGNGTNAVILELSQRINHDVFGWVNSSTTALNNTLNTFTDETMHVLNDTFGGTILYDPVMDVYNCLVGLKIAGIERGLTWAHEHAHIDFPSLPSNTFALGIAKVLDAISASSTNSSSASSASARRVLDAPADFPGPINSTNPTNSTSPLLNANAANSTTENILKELADHFLNKYKQKLVKECIVAAVVIGLYVVIIVAGIIWALLLAFGPPRLHVYLHKRALRKQRPVTPSEKKILSLATTAKDDLPGSRDEKRPSFIPSPSDARPSTPPPPVPHLPRAYVDRSTPPSPEATNGRVAGGTTGASGEESDDNGGKFRGKAYTIAPRPMLAANLAGTTTGIKSSRLPESREPATGHVPKNPFASPLDVSERR